MEYPKAQLKRSAPFGLHGKLSALFKEYPETTSGIQDYPHFQKRRRGIYVLSHPLPERPQFRGVALWGAFNLRAAQRDDRFLCEGAQSHGEQLLPVLTKQHQTGITEPADSISIRLLVNDNAVDGLRCS